MTTDKQREANRRNAKKSTGPVTKAGKQASSTNAIRHGAYAQRAIAIPRGELAEEQDQLDAFIDGVIAKLRPRGVVEREQAFLVAMAYVQARRIMNLEALGYTQATTLDELIAFTATITSINARVGAGVTRVLRDYRALLALRPTSGSLTAMAYEAVEEAEDERRIRRAFETVTSPAALDPPADEPDARNEPNSEPSADEEDLLDDLLLEQDDA
jgi:hypothetical protein